MQIPSVAEAWSEDNLTHKVRHYSALAGLRPELRLYDLRGSKVTELIWRERRSVADLALHMGWDVETAAKMMGIYGARNPDALGGGPKVVLLSAVNQGES